MSEEPKKRNGMQKISWINEKRKIEELNPATYNPRKMSPEQEAQLKMSIDRFDLADPIVVNLNNTIIGGHQRIKILKEQGWKEVDVRVPDRLLTEAEEKELNLRLNKNLGEWDFNLLSNFGEDMLQDVGFDTKEIDSIFKLETIPDEDNIPELYQETNIKSWDIFQLAEHRLMCGDSTNKEDVDKLMNGKKSQMIHTDPPYNVNYGVSKKPSHKIRKIKNDLLSPDEWSIFCHKLYEIFQKFNEGDIYMWSGSSPEGMRMRLWLIDVGCHWSATIIWKKQQLVLSPANYQRMYEPCFYGWFEKSGFNGDRCQTEVWEIDRPLNSKLHPTMKPIALCEKAILNSSKRNDIILDLFLGSGSTLIACEKINRICYGMELDPTYCQIIIDRWEAFTGKKAIKL